MHKVEVKQVHIDRGKPKCATGCPIYEAIKESGIKEKVHVGGSVITINVDEGKEYLDVDEYILDMNSVVQKWVEDFDLRGKDAVYPFTLHLDFENGVIETYT